MGITDKNFEKALHSSEAAKIRGEMGHKAGNKFIQEVHNMMHMPSNARKCGFD